MQPNRENAVMQGTVPLRHQPVSRIRGTTPRRGYALVLVCFFVVLFLALLGVAWRQMASVLRMASLQPIQTIGNNTSIFQTQRDPGSVPALALAVQMLETRLCLKTSNNVSYINVASDATQAPGESDLQASYTCIVIIDRATGSRVMDAASAVQPAYYKVAFDYESGYTDGSRWSVAVTPSTQIEASGLPAMPGSPP
jgi:hypothetical protein